mmetsp:Transcript_11520/g.13954  ORF Transcript_11520/g.13954 Transcript_11520/m.13954 type:complete len:394 (-) Transcript_11520:39-1220(-)
MDCFKLDLAKFPPKSRRYRTVYEDAVESGLGLAGFEKTKTGHDDKEVAYIVRQNWCLKCIFITFVLFALGIGLVFSTTLRVEVFRRDAIQQEVKHRVSEHGAQVKLLSVRVELKEALEHEVNQHHRLEEYKSLLARYLGDLETSMKSDLKHMPSGTQEKFMIMLREFRDPVQEELQKIIWESENRMERSQEMLPVISNAIINDIAEDVLEQNLYKKKLKQYGVRANEAEKLQKKGLKSSLSNTEEISLFEQVEKQKLESSKIMERLVDSFFQKIENSHFPIVDEKTIKSWDSYLSSVIETLNDKEKETDLQGVIRNVRFMMQKYPGIKRFRGHTGDSVVSYLKSVIYGAKLSAHKDEVAELKKQWKSGKISTLAALDKVQRLDLEHLNDWIST